MREMEVRICYETLKVESLKHHKHKYEFQRMAAPVGFPRDIPIFSFL
jgi:hypothetical protein